MGGGGCNQDKILVLINKQESTCMCIYIDFVLVSRVTKYSSYLYYLTVA